MTDFITVTGTIGTDPEHKVVSGQLSRTTFRLASSERRRTPDGQSWEDHHTNWYSVTCFGRLATNVIASLVKGQRVIVSGKMRIRTYTREDGSQGTQVEIIASTAGHDLSFQVATAARQGSSDRHGSAGQSADGAAAPSNDSLAAAMGGNTYATGDSYASAESSAPAESYGAAESHGATGSFSTAEPAEEGDSYEEGVKVDSVTGEVHETPF